MSKCTALLLFLAVFLTGCSFKIPFKDSLGTAALQVASSPKAEVFLNNQSIGETPITNKKVKAGKYTLKLQAGEASWVGSVQLHNSTVTVVNRELSSSGMQEAGDVITLENGEGIAVIGTPQNAKVSVDQKPQGETPLFLPEITEGIHEFTIEKEGFGKRTLKLKATKGYKLVINTDLAQDANYVAQEPSSLPTDEPKPTTGTKATPTVKPSATPRTTTATSTFTKVQVKETPTGFLRIRTGPSTGTAEVGKVNPGDELAILDEQASWIKVSGSGLEGWASAQYLTKIP